GRDLTHHRPLAAIPVAAASEHDPETPPAMGTQAAQGVLERFRLVRVIDVDRRAARGSRHLLHSPGDADELVEHAEHIVGSLASADRETGGAEDVQRLEL